MRSLDQLIYHRKEIITVVVSRGKSCHCTFVLNNLCVVSVPESRNINTRLLEWNYLDL